MSNINITNIKINKDVYVIDGTKYQYIFTIQKIFSNGFFCKNLIEIDLNDRKYKIIACMFEINDKLFFDNIRHATIEEKERYFEEFNKISNE